MRILLLFLVVTFLVNIAQAKDIKVLLIDQTANAKNIHISKYYNQGFNQSTPGLHGNSMAMFVLYDGFNSNLEPKDPLCDNVKLDSCDAFRHGFSYFYCLTIAALGDYDVVNLSLGGPTYSTLERLLLERIVKKSKVVVSAGNQPIHIKYNYPAGYDIKSTNFYVVGDRGYVDSAFGEGVLSVSGTHKVGLDQFDQFVFVTGTSASAARYSHTLLKRMCRQK
jgi:hypothetical protein